MASDCKHEDTAKEDEIRRKWNGHHRNIYLLCTRIWIAVRNVLCNDSPEGHMPEDIDEIETIDTKDVLSYSFRAIHESRYVCADFSLR